jgi:hypothetical protein
MLPPNEEASFKKLVLHLGITRAQTLLDQVKQLATGVVRDRGTLPEIIPVRTRSGVVHHIRKDVLALTGLLSTRAGLRTEQIRKELRWDKRTARRAIAEALKDKRVTKTGRNRATTYFVVG